MAPLRRRAHGASSRDRSRPVAAMTPQCQAQAHVGYNEGSSEEV
jgi:hypothetical protein